jgi:hypothetical protein
VKHTAERGRVNGARAFEQEAGERCLPLIWGAGFRCVHPYSIGIRTHALTGKRAYRSIHTTENTEKNVRTGLGIE